MMANINNDGVGLAPYHDWDSKISADIKAKIAEATKALKAGTLKTGYPPEVAEEKAEPTKAPAATEKPAPTKAPAATEKPAPTKAPTAAPTKTS
jgi:hypothetical protein